MKPFFVTLLVVFLLPALHGTAQSREEFNGPMPGWADIKKQFGAKGDGRSDDTKAFQKAIDNFKNHVTNSHVGKGAYTVLYIPKGTYCISATLQLRGQIGVSIIGEDPNTTVIKWIGADKNTMFWANGSAYWRIARLTWNVNGHKEMEGIGIHWKDKWDDGKTRSFASLNIEITDNYFMGGFQSGISGGTSPDKGGTGSNDSEVTIKRCIFERCAFAGININGFNALDYWVWDCKFFGCEHGIYCVAGNYHVYRSYFSKSHYFDMKNVGAIYTSMRNSYSENSFGFMVDDGASCGPFKRIFQNNTVVNPTNFPIVFLHLGKITLWNNNLSKVQDKTVNYWVHTGSWCPGNWEIMSIKNRYEIKDPLWNGAGALTKFTTGDSYETKMAFAASASTDFQKTMEPLPVKKVRKIFEVPAGADSRAIQNMINAAAALKGQRPIVYFRTGTWYIDKTLVIPANSDLQLMGDGLLYASVITRTNNSNFQKAPLIQVNGPSYITIKDLQIGEESDKQPSGAITFVNVDQPASQAHIDQLYSLADTSLVADKLDYLYIEKNNSFFSDGTYAMGGNLVKQGKGTARISCYGGQFAKLSVDNGAKFIAKDCWWEGQQRTPLNLKGSGEISLDGVMIAPWGADSLPTIRIGSFNGKISLVNMYMQGSVATDPGNAPLDLLMWNIHFYHKMNPYEYIKQGSSSRMALLGATSQCFDNREICKSIVSIPDKNYRINDLPGFLDKVTAYNRSEKPILFQQLASGVSNIYISRTSIGAARRGIVFLKQ